MPFLDKSVQLINQALTEALLSEKRFSGGAVFGLAKSTIIRDKDGASRKFPYIVNANGEPESVSIDDTFPIMIYHRRASDSSISASRASFGDDVQLTVQQPMSMIVFGKGNALRLSDEQMETFITLAMPSEISKSALIGTQIDKLTTIPTGTRMDSISVFSEEYQGIEYPLDQMDFLIKINYSIITTLRRECISICDC